MTTQNTFWSPYNHLAPPLAAPTLSPYYDVQASDNLAIGALFSWAYPEGEELAIESRVGVSFVSRVKAYVLGRQRLSGY